MLRRLMGRREVAPIAIGLALWLFWFTLYTMTCSPTVNFIDSGEIITALHEPGILHPPGYPLYTLLGYVVSHVPFGAVAFRVNLMSAFWGACGIAAVYFLCLSLVQSRFAKPPAASRPPGRSRGRGRGPIPAPTAPDRPAALSAWLYMAAVSGASLLGASSTYWSRSVQAKMYTLHYFLVAVILLLAVQWRTTVASGEEKRARRYLFWALLTLGLSFANHLMTALLVVPFGALLLAGPGWRDRAAAVMKSWRTSVPALVLPLLLYLYLPLRSSLRPTMNWGDPRTFPDFYRHVSGWQYQAYITSDMGDTARRLASLASDQWGSLTPLVALLALAGGALLLRHAGPMFWASFLYAVITLGFALRYGISEIEPYLVPIYLIGCLWIGAGAGFLSRRSSSAAAGDSRPRWAPAARFAPAVLAVLAAVSAVFMFPGANHSNDYLAELSFANAAKYFEPNAIVITDHWDYFYSPSYYEQIVRGKRPDLVIIDKSLLRYPWYLGQLSRRYPWLVQKSQDLVAPFSVEQDAFVNGRPYDPNTINQLYLDLLTSFVERNIGERPAYLYLRDCDPSLPPQYCENNQIAPAFARQPWGMALRLWPKSQVAALPPMPDFDLSGYTQGKVPLDDFGRLNAQLYLAAYQNSAQEYLRSGKVEEAQALLRKQSELSTALKGR